MITAIMVSMRPGMGMIAPTAGAVVVAARERKRARQQPGGDRDLCDTHGRISCRLVTSTITHRRACIGAVWHMQRNDRKRQGLERVAGIEPAYSAWKAAALPLCYTRSRRMCGGSGRRAPDQAATHASRVAYHCGLCRGDVPRQIPRRRHHGPAAGIGGRPRHRAGGDGRDDRLVRDCAAGRDGRPLRSEEHTSELQSLMRISYAVFCLNKKTIQAYTNTTA